MTSSRRREPIYATERGKAYHRDTCDVVLQAIVANPRTLRTLEPGQTGNLFPCQLCDPPRRPTLTVLPGGAGTPEETPCP